jgi:hypothetical protein
MVSIIPGLILSQPYDMKHASPANTKIYLLLVFVLCADRFDFCQHTFPNALNNAGRLLLSRPEHQPLELALSSKGSPLTARSFHHLLRTSYSRLPSILSPAFFAWYCLRFWISYFSYCSHYGRICKFSHLRNAYTGMSLRGMMNLIIKLASLDSNTAPHLLCLYSLPS